MNTIEYLKAFNFDVLLIAAGIKAKKLSLGSFTFKRVIAADGGFDRALSLGVDVDVLIGDNDSIVDISSFDGKRITFNREKDKTDAELALDYIEELGLKRVLFLSALGNRIDHSLANIYLIKAFADRGIKVVIYDDNNIIELLEGERILDKDDCNYSIIPIDLNGIKVNLEGFYYPANNLTIPFASSLAISNKIIENKAKIKHLSGNGLLVRSFD